MNRSLLLFSLLIFLGISSKPAHAIMITSAAVQPDIEADPRQTGFAQFFFDITRDPSSNSDSATYGGQQLLDGSLAIFTLSLNITFDDRIFPPGTAGKILISNILTGPDGTPEREIILFGFSPQATSFEFIEGPDSPILGPFDFGFGPQDKLPEGVGFVSWGIVPSSVPDAGTTLLLLGLSIGGLAGVSRFLALR